MIELVMAILFFALAIVNATVMILFFLPERKYKACHPDVSVIIPAHNEESTIKSTVESVLSSSYAGNMEIIIVNDGSTDGTAARVPKNKKLRLFNVKHGGKAAAINFGVRKAKYETIVFLDADSRLKKDSIALLVAPLADKDIAVTSGVVLARQTKNPFSWFQSLDYIVYSGWRYSCSKINATYVAPGFGAIKKSALQKVGGFSSDTLTEDIDTTLTLRKSGFGAVMTLSTIMTSTPSSLGAFIRQRARWGRGTIQTAKKHKDMMFKKNSIGMYGFPMHMFWYPFALIYLPLSLYWMFQNYFAYGGGIMFFLNWLTIYGIFSLFQNVIAGNYALTPIIGAIMASWLLSFIYFVVTMRKFSAFSWKILSYLVIFPYNWLVFGVQGFTFVVELFSRRRGNVWTK
ncbi:MAG TPA: glycosyltransferase [archaeon]|nr:glycosyltransferase [archaeon]